METIVQVEEIQREAAEIAQCDLISDKAAAAVVKLADGRNEAPSIEDIREVCRNHRAPIRVVAASLGLSQCLYCGEWVQLFTLPNSDAATCPHVAEIRTDAELAAVYVHSLLLGRMPIKQSFAWPHSFDARSKEFHLCRHATADTSLPPCAAE